MNSSRGIFEPQEGFAPAPPTKSPFAVADDAPASSPFAVVSEPQSPFASMKDDPAARGLSEPARPAKLPERRPAAGETPPVEQRSPFAVDATATSPFDQPAPVSSPFATVAPAPVAAAAAPAPATVASPFGFDAEPAPAAAPAPVTPPAPAQAQPPMSSPAAPPAPASAPVQAPAAAAPAEEGDSDSHSIRQLELRAIFGVDRELGAEEMLQRTRQLSGIRHVARVPSGEIATVDAFKRVISSLGFPPGQVKLVAGNIPIEFIREGKVILAVQNDGSFAPGVKETLMIVARELGKL